jgi:two-component system response regulator MprA
MTTRTDMSTRVLVVEDDPDLRRLLRASLGEEGFEVATAANGRDALRASTGPQPDLMVIDIGLPDADGRDLCQALRAQGSTAPVLFLTALDAVTDRVSGFSAGGDDYLTKPFALAELAARLRSLAKRGSVDLAVSVGGLRLDPVAHSMSSGDRDAALTPTEFRVLGALIAEQTKPVRRRELIRAGWPDGAIVHDNTLDVYVGRLRRKLAKIDAPASISTVHRVGYRLE